MVATKGYALYNETVVFVRQLSDFPTPSGGVITLAANTTYLISGTISLGSNTITLSNGTCVSGINQATDILSYIGTGTMISATSVAFSILSIAISCPSGTILNIDDAVGTSNGLLDGVVIVGAKTLGIIQGLNHFVIHNCIISGTTTNGFTTGATHPLSNLAIINSSFQNNVGTLFSFDSTTIGYVSVNGNLFYATAGQTVFSGTPTVSTKIQVINNAFTGGGTYTSQNIIPSNNYCAFATNVNVADTRPIGESSFVANATSTTITVQGTFYKASGTTTAGTNSKFTQTNNRLTYTGIDAISMLVVATFSAETANNNQTIAGIIAKNGSTIPTSEMEVRQNTANQASTGTSSTVVSLTTNDYIEFFVTNKTATNAVMVNYMNLTAR